ncbi:alpha/beta hydrolase [Streptomyces sp. NBC_00572]|uniref:alpha/beta hydrolase n=1 Tax=Streptomyces sp. NBC_00572 TaxID=2903664 RepID=UPI00225881EA|nr:alpha/beta hydrolase [Streptomyces sp. NBC_00572]MCX4986966.1 alpha/beta hydrolase [Streptomyces sp. NBC_00572]
MQPEPDREADPEQPPPAILDPLVQRLVDAASTPPYLHELEPGAARQALQEAQGDRMDDFDVEATFHAAPVGPTGLVGFWVVRPTEVTGRLPTLLYVHGGRWMLGDGHTHAWLISELVREAGVAAVVPEYSRTPESRYPVALEECYDLLTWAVGQSESLGLDTDRLAVAGDCAGATLATALTLLARARGGPEIRAQLLYYPLTDARCDSPSQRLFATGYPLTREAVQSYWRQYAADPRQRDEATAAPLRASTDALAGLPPALVVTAEADVARDEAEEYAGRLLRAGVAATAARFQGTVHDFVSLTALRNSPSTRAAVRLGGRFLRARLR